MNIYWRGWFLPVFLCLVGCGEPDGVGEELGVGDAFAKRIEEEGVLAFVAWDGVLKGEDADSILHFKPDSAVRLEDGGLGVRKFSGTYSLGESGQISVLLDGYEKEWPVMVLRADGEELLLDRQDGKTSWLPDVPDAPDGYWPFRAVELE